MTASLPLFLVGFAAYCGGLFARNSASPHAKPPHYTTRPGPNLRVFGYARYPAYTAGTDPLYPRTASKYWGSKLVLRFLFPAHYLAGYWRATKIGPNLMFKKPRLRLSSDVFPLLKGLRVYRLLAYPALTTDIVSFLCLPTLNLPTVSIVII